MSLDLLALTLDEAVRAAEAAGMSVRVVETRPPRGGEGRGAPRVIRQHHEAGALVLTVTYERYQRPAAPTVPATTPDPADPAGASR